MENKTKKSKKKTNDSTLIYDLIGLLIRIAWILLLILAAYVFLVGLTVQHGETMEPSFHNGDLVAYYKLGHDYDTGDVVVYKGKDGDRQLGRIIAKPGDEVEITEDGVKVNGYYQNEKYASEELLLFSRGPDYPLTLSSDEYFILFDVREEGEDSRLLGAIREKEISGRVMLSIRKRDF